MRVFSNDSIWNQDTQEWEEFFTIDQVDVSPETFYEQTEVEELGFDEDEEDIIDEDIIDPNCQCCNCDDQCDEFNCTCGECTEDVQELEEDYMECDCPDCIEQRMLDAMEDGKDCNEDRENDLITECLDVVFSQGGCVDCTIDKIIETLYRFKELGKLEVKEEIRDFLD